MEKLTQPTGDELKYFLHLAGQEGWCVPEAELEYCRSGKGGEFLVLRTPEGPAGFVSTVRHERSAWIGNLLVPSELRGQGFGRQLFEEVVRKLEASGVLSIWLTASEMGEPLYASCGFIRRDAIVRWSAEGLGASGAFVAEGSPGELYFQDELGWGDARLSLLEYLASDATLLTSGATCALVQPGERFCVLGPWYSPDLCPRENRTLLVQALESVPGEKRLVSDLLESSPVNMLMQAAGFTRQGRTLLMHRGHTEWAPSRIVSLASLGSMG